MIRISNIYDEILNKVDFKIDDCINIGHVIAWKLLYVTLKEEYNIDLNNEVISYNQDGKPYIKGNKIFFNITHSKDLVGVVISDSECGIDIEYVDTTRKIDKLAKYMMSDEEFINYNNSNDKVSFFYDLWVKKECYTKFIGNSIFVTKDDILPPLETSIIEFNGDKYYLCYMD